MLIPLADWAVQRDQHVELLGMPKTAAEFLEPLLANLTAGVAAVAEAQRRGKVEIGADGMLHLPAIAALADRGEPAHTRETIYSLIGNAQFPDMLLERLTRRRHQLQRGSPRPSGAVHGRTGDPCTARCWRAALTSTPGAWRR